MVNIKDVTVGILAGGKATRMENQDKGLVNIHGEPLIERLLNKIIPYSKNIVINANRNIKIYENYGFPVVKDILEDFQGPLSGILSLLNNITTNFLFTVPCDCPNFNWEIVQKIINLSDIKNEICIAHDGDRAQPVFMLVSKSKTESISCFLASENRKIDIWYKSNNFKYIYFDKNFKYFENINTIEQLNDFNKK